MATIDDTLATGISAAIGALASSFGSFTTWMTTPKATDISAASIELQNDQQIIQTDVALASVKGDIQAMALALAAQQAASMLAAAIVGKDQGTITAAIQVCHASAQALQAHVLAPPVTK